MARTFDKTALLAAFDRIGAAAIVHGQKIDIFVYGGSALMLASNFRYATEDVDIAPLDPWPDWLKAEALSIARENRWREDWLNDGVGFHLNRLADKPGDHEEFQSFPRAMTQARGEDEVGLRVHVPNARYMLALKLKAMRVGDPEKWAFEARDIVNLLRVNRIENADEAIAVMAAYFPVSASDAGKQRFLLKILAGQETVDAPEYPQGSDRKNS